MTIELTGIDGSNPMGFFAAIGALAASPTRWRLGWRSDGTWIPFLEGPRDSAELLDAIAADHRAWGAASLLTDLDEPDIKMPAESFRAAAEEAMARPRDSWARTADWLGVLGNETIKDLSGKNIKPTALHYAAGQQKFLTAVREIHGFCADNPGAVSAALFEPWQRRDDVKSLSFDATVSRNYALRLKDPSGDKKLTDGGAEWLAFRGLEAFPSAPRGTKLHTACCGGGWKTGWFRWPLWEGPASLRDVRAALLAPKVAAMTAKERRARGIFACFRAAIQRTDQGGYGSFAPPGPAARGAAPR